MKIIPDMLRAWRYPRQVMRGLLAQGLREDRALVFVMTGCLLMFVAQWPRLMRESLAEPLVPFDARVGAALLGWIFLAPLFFYAFAAISHLVSVVFGGRDSWLSARLALFWAVLAASPVWLLNGLVTAFAGPAWMQTLTAAIALAGLAMIWLTSFIEASVTRGAP